MPLYNHTAFTPSVDAVEEFKVLTSSYSAEFGQGAGARIQVTMKGGTNELHGMVFNLKMEKAYDMLPGAEIKMRIACHSIS